MPVNHASYLGPADLAEAAARSEQPQEARRADHIGCDERTHPRNGGRLTMSGLSYAGVHHVKFPVTDLDASVQWYETVLKAKREPRFDHLDADGKRFAVITFWPGVDVPCELRLAPKAAKAVVLAAGHPDAANIGTGFRWHRDQRSASGQNRCRVRSSTLSRSMS